MSFPGDPVFPQHDYPCTKDCPERSGTCHGTCERYLKARAENEKIRLAIRGIEKGLDDYTNYRCNKTEQYRKELRRRKK